MGITIQNLPNLFDLCEIEIEEIGEIETYSPLYLLLKMQVLRVVARQHPPIRSHCWGRRRSRG